MADDSIPKPTPPVESGGDPEGKAANEGEAVSIKVGASTDENTKNTQKDSEKSSNQNEDAGAMKENDGDKNVSSEDKKHVRTDELRHRDWREKRDSDNKSRGTPNRRFHQHNQYQDRKKWARNVKTKFDDLPESSDPDAIRHQVEFYFCDSNLPADTYMLQLTGGSENNPVPIKKLHAFKRMRHFQPYSAVLAALEQSDKLVVNNPEGESTGEETVCRKEPLKAELAPHLSSEQNFRTFNDQTMSRTIYAKGFGDETSTTQFDIEAFFAPYGPFNAVRLRRTFPEKIFKGSVFVEFDSDETAQTFLAIESKPKWKGEDLMIKSKQVYVGEKKALRESERAKGNYIGGGNRGRDNNGRGGRSNRGGRGDRGRGRGRGNQHGGGSHRGEKGQDREKKDKDSKGSANRTEDDDKGPEQAKNRRASAEADVEVKTQPAEASSSSTRANEATANGKRKRGTSAEDQEAGPDHDDANKKVKQ